MATWSAANSALVITERQALLDARLDEADGGALNFYNSSDTLIATCALSATAFGSADGSVLATANAISPDMSPDVGETIDYAKIRNAGDTADVIELTVGITGSGMDVIVAAADLVIPTGAILAVDSCTVQG